MYQSKRLLSVLLCLFCIFFCSCVPAGTEKHMDKRLARKQADFEQQLSSYQSRNPVDMALYFPEEENQKRRILSQDIVFSRLYYDENGQICLDISGREKQQEWFSREIFSDPDVEFREIPNRSSFPEDYRAWKEHFYRKLNEYYQTVNSNISTAEGFITIYNPGIAKVDKIMLETDFTIEGEQLVINVFNGNPEIQTWLDLTLNRQEYTDGTLQPIKNIIFRLPEEPIIFYSLDDCFPLSPSPYPKQLPSSQALRMELSSDSYPADTISLICAVKNQSESSVYYDSSLSLEYFDGGWYSVPFRTRLGPKFDSEYIRELSPGKTLEEEIYLGDYATLIPGKYRFVKPMSEGNTVSAEFTISEQKEIR